MKISDMINIIPCEIVAGSDLEKQVNCVYCCDLLSVVMGKAPEKCAWFTVMGNINAVAVSTLADVSCIVIAEDMSVDEEAINKANNIDVIILKTSMTIFEAAKLVDSAIGTEKANV